ncbi:hypothetical protein J1614_001261 [Plenodomus biglobosus]|nr:hypothetical protein J1614_001261 [Plenodomus biglobosus]
MSQTWLRIDDGPITDLQKCQYSFPMSTNNREKVGFSLPEGPASSATFCWGVSKHRRHHFKCGFFTLYKVQFCVDME